MCTAEHKVTLPPHKVLLYYYAIENKQHLTYDHEFNCKQCLSNRTYISSNYYNNKEGQALLCLPDSKFYHYICPIVTFYQT